MACFVKRTINGAHVKQNKTGSVPRSGIQRLGSTDSRANFASDSGARFAIHLHDCVSESHLLFSEKIRAEFLNSTSPQPLA